MAGLDTWTIEQGATFERVYEWHDGAEDGPLIPFATSGYPAVRSQIRRRQRRDAELILTLTEAQLLLDEPDDGMLTVRLGADVTEDINREGWYDIEIYDPDDATKVIRFAQGPVVLDGEVTTVAS